MIRGKHAFVGTGAVGTGDVPDDALLAGTPARGLSVSSSGPTQ